MPTLQRLGLLYRVSEISVSPSDNEPSPGKSLAPVPPADYPAFPMLHQPAQAPSVESENSSSALRLKQIAEAAFYLAEKRGFEPGYHVDDWLTAELQIDALRR